MRFIFNPEIFLQQTFKCDLNLALFYEHLNDILNDIKMHHINAFKMHSGYIYFAFQMTLLCI